MRYVPSLDEPLVAEALRQNHALWAAGRTPEEHYDHNLAQLAQAGPDLLRYVGLVDGGALVASIKRYGLLLGDAARPLRAIGIGAVFTREDRRGKGAAAELLGAVVTEASDLGYAAAVLYSDIDPAYYARLGFRALEAVEHEAAASALPSERPLEVRAATADDLDRLLAMHAEAGAASGLVQPARCRASWRYFAKRNHVGSGHLLLGDDGDVVGYLLAGRDDPQRDLPDLRGDALWIDEWAAPGVDRARILATARSLAERAGLPRVRAWLRPDLAGAPFAARARREALPMILAMNGHTFDLGRTFLPSFEHF